jgi:septal ring factor EnvC (AmiA/AmiB activator)
MDDQNRRRESMSERIKEIYKGMMLNNAIGICLDGSSWHGWIFAKHPDGQWVSLCKIDMWQALTSTEAELQAEREKVKYYHDKNQEKCAEIDTLRQELTALKERLAGVEEAIQVKDKQAVYLKSSLISWRRQKWPGTDQEAIVNRDLEIISRLTKQAITSALKPKC